MVNLNKSQGLSLTPRECCNVQAIANNFSMAAAAVPPLLNVVDAAHRVVGAAPLTYVSSLLNRMSGHLIPTWNPYMPRVCILRFPLDEP